MTTTDSTEHRAAVKALFWEDHSRDKDRAAIVYLDAPGDPELRPGYYVVEAILRNAEGHVTCYGRQCAYRSSIAAAQHALDAWGKRCVTGGKVSIDEVLDEYAKAREEGLISNHDEP